MNFVRGGRAFLPAFQDKIADHLARICVYNYRRVVNCLCKCRSSRSRFELNREFFFFSLAINTRAASCWLGITLRRGLSTSCIARVPPSFIPLFSAASETHGYSYLTRGGAKKWRVSRIGPFENLPIVRRRAERPRFSGVRLEHISAGVSFPCETFPGNTLFASAIWPQHKYIREIPYGHMARRVRGRCDYHTLTLPE